MYAAFDLTYDYDIWPLWQAAVRGHAPVGRYLEMLRFQNCIYPANHVKMRCVENHDQPRIMALARMPSLFDIDKVNWGRYELQPYLTALAGLKKDPALLDGRFVLLDDAPAIQAAWQWPGASLYGVFNTSGAEGTVAVQLPGGTYTDLLSGDAFRVRRG